MAQNIGRRDLGMHYAQRSTGSPCDNIGPHMHATKGAASTVQSNRSPTTDFTYPHNPALAQLDRMRVLPSHCPLLKHTRTDC